VLIGKQVVVVFCQAGPARAMIAHVPIIKGFKICFRGEESELKGCLSEFSSKLAAKCAGKKCCQGD
jgi:hypothetical protein